MLGLIKQKYKEMMKPKKTENIIEATRCLSFVRQLFGLSVLTIQSSCGQLNSRFTPLGFAFFLIWYLSYFYSTYTVIVEDQTILRKLYNTRLKHYGDEVEVLVTSLLVVYATWKIPFDISGNVKCIQGFVDIDRAIENIGEHIDYAKDMKKFLLVPLTETLITCSRILCVYALKTDTSVELTKVFQMVYFDFIAFVITSQFCFFLYMLRIRYDIINRVLQDINERKSREYVMFRVQQHGMSSGGVRLQDKYLCEKLRACGKIYSKLQSAATVINDKFSFAIAITMLLCLFLVVLYLYYFMEATASGLFHDPNRFINFMINVVWVIIYALLVIFLSICFSEHTVRAAKLTPNRAHEIINSDLDSSITKEAANLSLQALHQIPVFTAAGLAKLNYELLLEGAKTVVTFLVIMLQFVTDSRPKY